MQSVNTWLEEYAESHQHATNKLLHWICVPLIVFSLIGMLWSLPVPAGFANVSPLLNWGTILILAALVYYFMLSRTLGLGMTLVSLLIIAAAHQLDTGVTAPLWALSLALFVLAWIGQFIGHMVEGKRPSFFKDVQFLMIGPLWLLSFVYRKLRIPF